ncbi:MAG: DUF1844 domain-containing protein [Actinomycetota bacterium]|nr:DUF1844 domain-containing protein [Actinomycetota bacterium]
MSTIWTPGGERPVGGGQRPPASPSPPAAGAPSGPPGGRELSEAELEAKMVELRRQLAETPAELVVANHAYGLFELAALHLSLTPPQLPQAQLAIDALGALVEGLAGRLGEEEEQLREGLAQLRLAFVQMKAGAG